MPAARVTSLAIRHNQFMIEPSLGRRQMGGRVIRARRLERVNIDPAAQVALWCANTHLYLSLVHSIPMCPNRDNLWSVTHPRLTVSIVGVADGSVVDYKLVLGGVEGMLVRVTLEDSGCCAGVEDKASQNSLSESSEMHGNGEFPVVQKSCFVTFDTKQRNCCRLKGTFPFVLK